MPSTMTHRPGSPSGTIARPASSTRARRKIATVSVTQPRCSRRILYSQREPMDPLAHAPGEMNATSTREPWQRNAVRTAGWVGVASLFGVWVGLTKGAESAGEYFAAYLVETSLSIDNVFVFAIVFTQLHIPAANQRRVLAAGVGGAFVLRAVAVLGGIALIDRFHWIIYPFAALITLGAVRLLIGERQQRRVVEQACNVCSTWI